MPKDISKVVELHFTASQNLLQDAHNKQFM